MTRLPELDDLYARAARLVEECAQATEAPAREAPGSLGDELLDGVDAIAIDLDRLRRRAQVEGEDEIALALNLANYNLGFARRKIAELAA